MEREIREGDVGQNKMTVHRSFVRWKSGREEISFLSSPWLYRFFSSEDSASLALSGRGKRDKGERRGRGGEFVTVACEFRGRHSKLIAPRWQDIWSFIYTLNVCMERSISPRRGGKTSSPRGLKCLHFQRT